MNPSTNDTRPRVLHLLKWLPRGGIETWLTHVFAASKNSAVRHEVLLMQDEIGPYEEKVRAAGVRIHTLPVHGWGAWLFSLYRFFKDEGPFDAFHAHVDTVVSGPAVLVARLAGVPVRIVHGHAARSIGPDYQKATDNLREVIGRRTTALGSTRRIAISEMAMHQLAGPNAKNREDCTILLYGFDYSAFHDASTRASEHRKSHGIPEGIPVIGHVGRFDSQKNHGFLLKTFAEFSQAEPEARLILIGRGPLKDGFEQMARDLGIIDNVIFVEGTDDVPGYMAMFDLFVFPSFSEGLGIVVLEAQAAGCPVLMPPNMPQEVIVVDEAIDLLDLNAGPHAWAARMSEILRRPSARSINWRQQVEGSVFGMERCVRDLDGIYAEEFSRWGTA